MTALLHKALELINSIEYDFSGVGGRGGNGGLTSDKTLRLAHELRFLIEAETNNLKENEHGV